MNSPKTKKERKSKSWKPLAITALATIIFTLASAWFTIYRSELRALRAEYERARNVRNNLVQIIEECIINKEPLDYTTLIRLIEVKSYEENLTTKICARRLFEQAEFNILQTRYLGFKQKEEYKKIFDKIYNEMIPEKYDNFVDIPYADSLNNIVGNIKEGKTRNSLILLNQLAEALDSEWTEMISKGILPKSFILTLFQTPYFIIFMTLYVLIIIFFPGFIRFFRSKKQK